MEIISYVFSGDAWAWLIQAAGAQGTASLPLLEAPDLVEGEKELQAAGCLLLSGQQRMVEPVLMYIAGQMAQARWHVDLNVQGTALICSAGPDCCLIAERLRDGRISVLPLPTPRAACQELSHRFVQTLKIGWRQKGTPQEIETMSLSGLRERLEKAQEEYKTNGQNYC